MDEENMILKAQASPAPSYLPPSILKERVNWDVFLSFQGNNPLNHQVDLDSSYIFTQTLSEALNNKELRPFMAYEDMVRHDTTPDELHEAILDSAISVAVISPLYANSQRCLNELSGLLECRKRIIPVFYMVDPSDVRRQRENTEFGEGFKRLVDGKSKDEVEKWRSALHMVGNISGYTFTKDLSHRSHEADKLIQRIVQQVSSELKNTPEYVGEFTIGLDSCVTEVVKNLHIYSEGVYFLGIHGTPGIGKTTLAKATYNKLVVNFKKRSFVSKVSEALATEGGLLSVQKTIIKDLSELGSPCFVKQVDDGKRKIERLVREESVLLVLDDVTEAQQLKDLGIDRKWFKDGHGSRIIVTSRNFGELLSFAENNIDELYEVKKLDELAALELFSVHALGRREPTQEFWSISKEMVSLAGGLPLALEVFGSSLVKKGKREWEDALLKLRLIRPSNLQDVLRLSYDGLNDKEKIVFLDISSLLLQLQMKRDDIVDILMACDSGFESAMYNLIKRSLLKITEDNELWMHDQIRDTGRQIVMEECSQDAGRRSRLWDSNEIKIALRRDMVTQVVRGITLDIEKATEITDQLISWYNFKGNPNFSTLKKYITEKIKGISSQYKTENVNDFVLNTKWFEKMVHLKLLRMDNANIQGDFRCMPSDLRWLRWKGCPQTILPDNIPKNIRVLDLSDSKIECLWSSTSIFWGFNKVVGNLVVLNLSYCYRLTCLPDLSGNKNLKKLILEHCINLTKINETIGKMSSLVYLNLRSCKNFLEFPEDISGMISLSELILSDCSVFKGLPKQVTSMKSITQLLLDRTPITDLPQSLFHLTDLQVLHLNGCQQLTRFPNCLGSLISLKELSVSDAKLEELPSSVGSLTNLEKLDLVHCSSLSTLPDSFKNLKSLIHLCLNGSSVTKLPEAVCSLFNLKVLSLGTCSSFLEFPASVDGLASLVELNLNATNIEVLPENICSLKFLEKLSMNKCSRLSKLPACIRKMSNLTFLFLEGAALTELPESIVELEKLTWLKLDKCRMLRSLPSSIGKLRSLRIFMMEDTGVTGFPESFGLLDGLMVLKVKKKSHSNDLPAGLVLPDSFGKLSNLEEFDAHSFGICGEIHDNFAKLANLEILDLGNNSFHRLPSTMVGMCVLKKLSLYNCKELQVLPQFPSTLEELNAADCHSLIVLNDLSNLEKLQELQLSNCNKIEDVIGLEKLKSLRRFFMGGCNAIASVAVRRRLNKVVLKPLNNLCIPGCEIPSWFSHTEVKYVPHPNLAIKSVIIAVVLSVNVQILEPNRAELPYIADIKASIVRQGNSPFSTAMKLMGLPHTQEEQLYLCRYKEYHPLVYLLKEGDIIQVGWSYGGSVRGIELKRWGIHLVYENDDDYDGDEDKDLLPLNDDEKSVSQRLTRFFHDMDK